jgi:hypothetical protein
LPYVDLETFRQILLLTLDINCKANVLRVVEILRSLEGIQSANPNYRATLDGERYEKLENSTRFLHHGHYMLLI